MKVYPFNHLTTLLLAHAAAFLSSAAHRLSTTVASNCSSDDTLLSFSDTSASRRESSALSSVARPQRSAARAHTAVADPQDRPVKAPVSFRRLKYSCARRPL